MVLLATLSMILKLGSSPRLVKYSMLALNASTMEVSLTLATGVAKIALEVQSYRLKIIMPCHQPTRGGIFL